MINNLDRISPSLNKSSLTRQLISTQLRNISQTFIVNWFKFILFTGSLPVLTCCTSCQQNGADDVTIETPLTIYRPRFFILNKILWARDRHKHSMGCDRTQPFIVPDHQPAAHLFAVCAHTRYGPCHEHALVHSLNEVYTHQPTHPHSLTASEVHV
jgi:hypothetical protein